MSQAGVTYCPTSFMNPVNFGNAWNKSQARMLGTTIAIESRALWLAGAVEQGPRNHIGLNHWSPNINIGARGAETGSGFTPRAHAPPFLPSLQSATPGGAARAR